MFSTRQGRTASLRWETCLEISQVRLLVEGRRLETEGVHDVVDLLGAFFESLFGIFSGGVGTCMRSRLSVFMFFWLQVESTLTNIDLTLLDDNHRAVHLESDTIDLLAAKTQPNQLSRTGKSAQYAATYMGKASENISSPVRISS